MSAMDKQYEEMSAMDKQYDALTPEQKEAFDKKMKETAEAHFNALANEAAAAASPFHGIDWHPKQLQHSPGDVFRPGTPAFVPPEEEKKESLGDA